MSEDTVSVSVEAIDKLTSPFASMSSAAQGFGQSLTGLAGIVEKAAGSMALFGAGMVVFEKLKEAIEISMEAERSIVTMQRSIENLGISFQKVGKEVEDAVDHMAEFTRFGREDTRGAIENLVVITQDYGKAMASLSVVADLATFRHQTLAEASRAFGMAVEGNTRVLRQIGIVLDADTQAKFKASSETERLTYLTTLLQNRLEGLTKVDAETWSGKWAIAGHQLQEVLKGIGDVALTALGKMETFFTGVRKGLLDALADLPMWQKYLILGPGAFIGAAPVPETGVGSGMGGLQSSERGAWYNRRQLPLPPLSGGPEKDLFTSDEERVSNQLNDLIRNIQIAAKNFGSMDAAVSAYKDSIHKLAEEQDKVGVEFTDFAPFLERLNELARGGFVSQQDAMVKAFNLATAGQLDWTARTKAAGPDIDTWQRAMDAESVKSGELWAQEAAKVLKDQFLKQALEMQKIFWTPGAAVFEDLLTKGGKNIGEIIGKSFLDEAKAGSDALFKLLVGGQNQVETTTDATGKVVYRVSGSDQTYKNIKDAQAAAAAGGGGVGGQGLTDALKIALAGGGAFANSFNQTGQSDLGAAVAGLTAAIGILTVSYGSLAAAGTAIGGIIAGEAGIPVVGWIAAVVTVVAAVVGKLLQPSPGSGYQYGTGIGISAQGTAQGLFNENVDLNTQKKWLGILQDQFDIFYNGYYAILLKLPHDILPKISEAFNAVYGKFESGADLGLASSEKFATELQAYFDVGLPHQIADRFSTAIRAGFEAVGFSESAFNVIWRQLSMLDPKKAMDFLNMLADAAIAINKAMDYLGKPTGFGTGGDPYAYMSTGGGGTMMLSGGDKNFANQMSLANTKLLEMANNIGYLVGPDKIQGWKDLSDALTQATSAEKKFVDQLQQAIASEAKSWQQLITGLQLGQMVDASGKPDYQKQVDFLKKQADVTFAALSTAPDVATTQSLSQDLQKIIQQIVSIGGQISPAAQQAYLKWGEMAAETARDAVIKRLQDLGAQLDKVNQDFIAKFQPIWDAYSKNLTDGSTATTTFNKNLDDASAGVKDFAAALSKATDLLGNQSSSGTQSVHVSIDDINVVTDSGGGGPARLGRTMTGRGRAA